MKEEQGVDYNVLLDKSDLDRWDHSDFVLGLFSMSDLDYVLGIVHILHKQKLAIFYHSDNFLPHLININILNNFLPDHETPIFWHIYPQFIV